MKHNQNWDWDQGYRPNNRKETTLLTATRNDVPCTNGEQIKNIALAPLKWQPVPGGKHFLMTLPVSKRTQEKKKKQHNAVIRELIVPHENIFWRERLLIPQALTGHLVVKDSKLPLCNTFYRDPGYVKQFLPTPSLTQTHHLHIF